jgi:hypothetical protein
MTRVYLYPSTEYKYENKTKTSTMPENQRLFKAELKHVNSHPSQNKTRQQLTEQT